MSEVGAPKQGLMSIGEEAKPPFAVLPDPSSLFLNRSKRLAALAPGHELAPYLTFLAGLTRAQHEIVPELPPTTLPTMDSTRGWAPAELVYRPCGSAALSVSTTRS